LREGGIAVRGLLASDAEAFSASARDPSIAHDAFHDRIDMADLDAVRGFITRGQERMLERSQVLLAVLDEDDLLVGQTMLFAFDHDNLSAELGFWVSPRARGRGVAATEIKLTALWGFNKLGLERISGLTATENVGAQRAMERAGFTREGVHRGLEKGGPTGRWDLVSYGFLASDVGGA
jgi:RimJ/RimL family protein N-acetyltransferase